MFDQKKYIKQWFKDNPEKKKEANERWRNSKKGKMAIKQWRKDNPKKVLRSRRKYRKNNLEKARESVRQWYKKIMKEDPKKIKQQDRRKHLFKKYNLSHEDWLKMWEDQDGKCLICGKPFTKPSDACVDHNHKTKKIRGLLCGKCNRGLGMFDDDQKIMKKAIKYLEVLP